MPNTLRFSLPGNKDSISTVREAVSRYAKSAGFSEEARDDISISITEACQIVCCQFIEKKACRFLLVCNMEEDTIQLKISSNNAEFIIDKEECEGCPYAAGDGELSMFIISSLMDKADLEENSDGSKTLIMEKSKNKEDLD